MHLEVLKPDVHLLSNYYAGKSNLWFDVQFEVVKLDVQLLQAHLIPRVIYSYRLRTIQLPYKLILTHVIPGLICT